jgi:non-homologous end joining protein Ku
MGSYRKELLLSLGLITAQVDLHSVAPTKKSGFNQYCAEHRTRIKQRRWCPEGDHEAFDVVSGMDAVSHVKFVDPARKPEFPKDDRLQLTPVPADEITAFAEGGFYYCQPSSVATANTWAALKAVLDKGKVAFVAKGSLRSGERKLWRLDCFNDYLVLRELRYPEDVRGVPEQVTIKPSREEMRLFTQVVDSMTVPWDKFDSANENMPLIERWLADAEMIEKAEQPRGTEVRSVFNLIDSLKEQLEQTQAS